MSASVRIRNWEFNEAASGLSRSLVYKLRNKLGAEVAHGEATLAFLQKAMALGMSEKDYALLYRDFEKVRKVRGRG